MSHDKRGIDEALIHLTNSHAEGRDGPDCGLPRTLDDALSYFETGGAGREQTAPQERSQGIFEREKIWLKIRAVAAKALLAAYHASLVSTRGVDGVNRDFGASDNHDTERLKSQTLDEAFCAYKTYGLDILIDTKGMVWLFEVNASPGPFFGGRRVTPVLHAIVH
jgi:hypothetical protein